MTNNKEDDIQKEALKGQQNKSNLEQQVAAGMHGGLELKKGEKNRFLGEFRERVLIALTYNQVKAGKGYQQVKDNIKDPEATKLIVNREVDQKSAKEYIRLAREANLSFKRVDSPDFTGDIALIVVSDHAVNKEDVSIRDKEKYLLEQGIPKELIDAQGDKVCADCYQLVKEKAPQELDNYQQFSWLDKLLGAECPGPH
ncbi:hypothetical protein Halha_2456 [Halobacteroides halobius DSM 5150]|uniref:DUF1694 domain-containing protein n=1 Tax=Halobacteroides halobius (strain ATCC 35273 / DSM 5150 / MD-1) TaxID=748449 RepID=L0KCR8_HALHC|nr:YueI family protein [Halobacteroides halobius]AGB42330.1 hypothetical protein Halha_2456 [Halobacteroides halobius DSM 5150]